MKQTTTAKEYCFTPKTRLAFCATCKNVYVFEADAVQAHIEYVDGKRTWITNNGTPLACSLGHTGLTQTTRVSAADRRELATGSIVTDYRLEYVRKRAAEKLERQARA